MADFIKKQQHGTDVNAQDKRADVSKQPIKKEAHSEEARHQQGVGKVQHEGRNKQQGQRLENETKNINKKA